MSENFDRLKRRKDMLVNREQDRVRRVHGEELTARVCQRGVDGSEGCGHSEEGFQDGQCWANTSDPGVKQCGHRCGDFSPLEAEVETLQEVANKFLTLVAECDRIIEEHTKPDYPLPNSYARQVVEHNTTRRMCYQYAASIVSAFIDREPKPALVHGEVVSEAHNTDCCALDDEGPRHNICGGWCRYCAACCKPHSKSPKSQVARWHEPPARVFIKYGNPTRAFSAAEVRLIGTENMTEYRSIAPILTALAECAPYRTDAGSVVVNEAGWDRLVMLIKGEN